MIPGTVIAVPGSVSYECSTGNGKRRCHVDQLILRWEQMSEKQEQASQTGVNEAAPSGDETTPIEPAITEMDRKGGSEKEAPATEGPDDMNGKTGMEVEHSALRCVSRGEIVTHQTDCRTKPWSKKWFANI